MAALEVGPEVLASLVASGALRGVFSFLKIVGIKLWKKSSGGLNHLLIRGFDRTMSTTIVWWASFVCLKLLKRHQSPFSQSSKAAKVWYAVRNVRRTWASSMLGKPKQRMICSGWVYDFPLGSLSVKLQVKIVLIVQSTKP